MGCESDGDSESISETLLHCNSTHSLLLAAECLAIPGIVRFAICDSVPLRLGRFKRGYQKGRSSHLVAIPWSLHTCGPVTVQTQRCDIPFLADDQIACDNDPMLIPRSTYRKAIGEGVRTITYRAPTSLAAQKKSSKFITNITTAEKHEGALLLCHKLATLMPRRVSAA